MRSRRELKLRKKLYEEVIGRYGKTMAIDFWFDALYQLYKKTKRRQFSKRDMFNLLDEVKRAVG